ncbi:transcriptional regulator MntR [Domibacillus indicus]|uniref:transcriptional regulator MntR n=1 Tax=Domibacillus indicus TaxID=1437523 RepID=UPI0006180F5B|nr:transcriptional regulator MntR [Domibacillus indicus]
MPTSGMEDYIEQIYVLTMTRGYAKACEIAEALSVHPSSVTRMAKKLSRENYLVYEKYRGIQLTSRGEEAGKNLYRKDRVLKKLLHLIGVENHAIASEIKGMKQTLSPGTIEKMELLVEFLEQEKKQNPLFS